MPPFPVCSSCGQIALEMVIVDVHTHVYPQSFVSLLSSRKDVPLIRKFGDSDTLRLVILPGEDDASKPLEERGRPVGPNYWNINRKIQFMNDHHIDISVVSLANPWLDFMPSHEAAAAAQRVNNDVTDLCAQHPGRLYAFGTLPLSAPVGAVVQEIKRLRTRKYMKGVILGTSGLGQGLDDPALYPVYQALEQTSTLIFLHPHYGLPAEVYGPRRNESGHVLPLALGFPLETTIAVTRMLLCGVWDSFPKLEVLLAHSGGTLPFLAGRIESCIAHDAHLKGLGKLENRRDVWDILKNNIFLDGVIYDRTGLKSAIEGSGADRIMFGDFQVTTDTNECLLMDG